MYLSPHPLCFSISWLRHRTGSSAHLGAACLRPSISSLHTGSSAHHGVYRLHTSISDSLLVCTWPPARRTLLHVTLAPLSPPISPRNFFQGCPNMCLCHLLTQPCVLTEPSHLISRLPCAHLKNWPQHYPPFHRTMSSSYVASTLDHFWLGSCRFTHYN